MLSRNAATVARRKRPTVGGVGLNSVLSYTIVVLCTIHAAQLVLALYCGNHINRSAKQISRSHRISQRRASCADDKAMTLCHTTNPRIDVLCHQETFLPNTQSLHVLRMSTKDDDIAVQLTNSVAMKLVNETASSVDGSSKRIIKRSSLPRTLVLAVPLMLKFALVLMIKFLTDLVVFPLLFTYRGTRIMKRRIFKIWDRWTSSPTQTAVDSTNGNDLSLENYSANGSSTSSESTSSY